MEIMKLKMTLKNEDREEGRIADIALGNLLSSKHVEIADL